MEEHIATLDADLKSTTTDLFATREKLIYHQSENKELHGQMTVINQVFRFSLSYGPMKQDITDFIVYFVVAFQSTFSGFRWQQQHQHR